MKFASLIIFNNGGSLGLIFCYVYRQYAIIIHYLQDCIKYLKYFQADYPIYLYHYHVNITMYM